MKKLLLSLLIIMKNNALIILLLICTNFVSQSQNSSVTDTVIYRNGKIILEEIVPVPNATSIQLYGNTKLFFTKAFKSAKDVIQSEDTENHIIVGKGKIEMMKDQGFGGKYCNFSITIQTKDGRYKYIIADMNTEFTGDTFGALVISIEESVNNAKKKGIIETDEIKEYYEILKPTIDILKNQMQTKVDDNW